MRSLDRHRWLAGMLLALFSGTVTAAIELSFAVDDIAGDDWSVKGIVLNWFSRDADHGGLQIEMDSVVLPQAHGVLNHVALSCELSRDDDGLWRCDDGKLVADKTPLGRQEASWQGELTEQSIWSFSIDKLRLGSGSFALKIASAPDQWQADLRLYRIAVPRMATLQQTVELPADWSIEGRASGRLQARGTESTLTRVNADVVIDRIAYSSPDGTQAAEEGLVKLDLNADATQQGWRFNALVGIPSGGWYSDPLFIDSGQTPVEIRAQGAWQVEQARVQFDSWSVAIGQVLNVFGTGALSAGDGSLIDLGVAARSDDVARLYDTLLQPFLIGTPADDMTMAGRLGLALHLDQNGLEQAGIDLAGFRLTDRQGRFSLGETNGSIAWDRESDVPISQLMVAGAGIYRIPTGPFDIRMRFAANRVDLEQPVIVPLLGGEIALDRFALQGALFDGEQPQWQASASLRDVSLDQLTEALGWPVFSGSVAGELKDMAYADQVFRIGGGLELRAFDGRLRVSDLNIQEPFSTVPILNADAAFDGLSLEQLTQTFSFGRIEGRLDGRISDIQLIGWQPDRFDLHFHTPVDDRSRRRISQRAVENLTELGNGGAAALSTTFLRVFEEFRYSDIDLKVQLQGDTAQLGGLARPDEGYYLVKGAGLPRIDVIGRNRRVAWKDLVERLRQIRVEGARIE